MENKIQISIWATEDEASRVEYLKEVLNRKTTSDLLRFLIDDAYKKILQQNTAIAEKAEA